MAEEYIKREPLLKIAKELQGNVFCGPLIVDAIEKAPAVDVKTDTTEDKEV